MLLLRCRSQVAGRRSQVACEPVRQARCTVPLRTTSTLYYCSTVRAPNSVVGEQGTQAKPTWWGTRLERSLPALGSPTHLQALDNPDFRKGCATMVQSRRLARLLGYYGVQISLSAL